MLTTLRAKYEDIPSFAFPLVACLELKGPAKTQVNS